MAPKLSLLEILDMIVGIIQLSAKRVQYSLGSLLNVKRTFAWEKNAEMFQIGYFCRRFSVRQIRAILGGSSTRPTYLQYCKSQGIVPHIEEVKNGGYALWVDKKAAPEKVFVFFHGGGFHVGLLGGHIKFINSVITEAKKVGVSLSTVILEYGLAPENQYPSQLIQAISLFQHLLDTGISPSQVIIGGESAGGNLILGLLSHILHPNPEFPVLPELMSKISGVIMLSPWVTFDTNSQSMKDLAEHDMIFPRILDEWSSGYLGTQVTRSPYLEPSKAPEGWWNGLPEVAEKILITAGTQEVMMDDLVAFAGVLKGVEGAGLEFKLDVGMHAVPVHTCEENGPENSILWSKQLRWVDECLSSGS